MLRSWRYARLARLFVEVSFVFCPFVEFGFEGVEVFKCACVFVVFYFEDVASLVFDDVEVVVVGECWLVGVPVVSGDCLEVGDGGFGGLELFEGEHGFSPGVGFSSGFCGIGVWVSKWVVLVL